MALIVFTTYFGMGVEFLCVFLGELRGVAALESVLYVVVGACLASVFWGLYVDEASAPLRGWIQWSVESGVLYVAIGAGRAAIARSLDSVLATSQLKHRFAPRFSTFAWAQLGSAPALALVYYLPGWSIALHSAAWGILGVPASLWPTVNPREAARFRLYARTAACAWLSLVFVILGICSHPPGCDDVYEPPSEFDGRPGELPALGENEDVEDVVEVVAETIEEPPTAPDVSTMSHAPETMHANMAEALEPSVQTPAFPQPSSVGAGSESEDEPSDNETAYEDVESEQERDGSDGTEDPEEKSESRSDDESREDREYAEDEPAPSPGAIISTPSTGSTDDSDEAPNENSRHVQLTTTGPKEQIPVATSTGEPGLPTRLLSDTPLAAEALAVAHAVMDLTLGEDAARTMEEAGVEEQVVRFEETLATEEVEGGPSLTPSVLTPTSTPAGTPGATESSEPSPSNPLGISEHSIVLPPRAFGNLNEDATVDPQTEPVDESAIAEPASVPTGEETFIGALELTILFSCLTVNEERDALPEPECNESSDLKNIDEAPADTTGLQPGAGANDLLSAPTAVEAQAQVPAVYMAERPSLLGHDMDSQPAGLENPSHIPGVNPPADPAEEATTDTETTAEKDWQHARGADTMAEPNVTGGANQEQAGEPSTATEDNVGTLAAASDATDSTFDEDATWATNDGSEAAAAAEEGEAQAGSPGESIVVVPGPVSTHEEISVGTLEPIIPPTGLAANEEWSMPVAQECDERLDLGDTDGAPTDAAGSQPAAPSDDPLPAPTTVETRAQDPATHATAESEVASLGMDPQPAGVDNPSHIPGPSFAIDPTEEVGANEEQAGGSSTTVDDNIGHMPEGATNEELPETWGHVLVIAHQAEAEVGAVETGIPLAVTGVPAGVDIGELQSQTVAEQAVGPEIPPPPPSLAPAPAVALEADAVMASPTLIASEPVDDLMASPVPGPTSVHVYPFAAPSAPQLPDAVLATTDVEMAPPPRKSAFADSPRLRRHDPASYLRYYKARAHVTVLKKAIRPSFLPLEIPIPPVPASWSSQQNPGRASAFCNVPPLRPYDPSSSASYYRNRAWVTAMRRECRRMSPGWEAPDFVPEFVIPAVPVSWTCPQAQMVPAA
ncbi:hypothetical protein FRC08_014626 [Ceratobasidium sp. 394]|nr:hypothetical protein FRC08_014626 [Ceratobasidium sp. 394]KAG9092239.1 hypothetical protein FS749_015897 [Ceratobasidium sp. UAMH 11750]